MKSSDKHGLSAAAVLTGRESRTSRPINLKVLTVANGKKARQTPADDTLSRHAESLRALRSELLMLTQPSRTGQMIAIVSADSGDGRSRLAAELAMSFAQLRIKTLLVDADLRNPSLQTMFAGRDTVLGLSDALVADELPTIESVDGSPTLDVIMAGNPVQNALDLLSDGRFARMAEEWRRKYQFVLVDTPPLSKYADSLTIAHAAGQTLVITRADHSSLEASRTMLRRLASTQTKVIGAIVNRH